MSRSAVQAGIHRLRDRLAAEQGQQGSDEELLRAFLSQRDGGAFAALMRRYGAIVLGVCRRVLRHEQDAEDAFQATFLVLARSAASLRDKTALSGFLYGTAYRTAMKARQSAARRRRHEGETPPRPAGGPSEDLLWREVRALLDEEIARLPDAYRSVFVLCCLESLSQAEVGRRLGLKPRTVCHRLAEARRRLSGRLARRGVELSVVLGAVALVTRPAAALPSTLLSQTTRGALAAVGGGVVQGGPSTLSPAVTSLVEAAAGRTKLLAVALLAASLLGGIGLWASRGLVLQAVSPPSAAAPPQSTAADKAKASDRPQTPRTVPEAAKTVELQGRVLGTDGKAKAGAKLVLLGKDEKVASLGVSAADGRFRVRVPKRATLQWDHWLVARADGAGIDFLDLVQVNPRKPVELRLVIDHAIRGRVVNTEGKPIRGVRVSADKIEVYLKGSLDTFLAACMKMLAGGAGTGLERQIWSGAGGLFATTTDADGRFVLHGLGCERTVVLRLSGAGIAATSAWVANRAGFDPRAVNQARLDSLPRRHLNWRWWVLHGPNMSLVAEPEKVVRGIVKDADTGKGQPGVVVQVTQDSEELVQFPPEARTDAQGRYEIHGVRKAKRYLLAIESNPDTATMASQVWANDTAGYQPVQADIKIKKGVIVTGKMSDGTSGEPLHGVVMAAVLQGNPFVKDYPNFSSAGILPIESAGWTDADGVFRVVTLPGPVLLMGKSEGRTSFQYHSTRPDPKYPQYFDNGGYRGHSGFGLLQGQFNKVLEIKPGIAAVHQDIVLERAHVLMELKIQDAEGRPLADVLAASGPDSWIPDGRLEEGSGRVYGDAGGKPQLLVCYHPERKLAGSLTWKGEKKQPVVLELGPAGAIKGRLLDVEGKPLANVVVDLDYTDPVAGHVHKEAQYGEQIVTDARGAFAFDQVIPGLPFELTFRRGIRKLEPAAKPAGMAIQVKPGACRDVGDIKVQPAPGKGKD
jgi:RNA polymerase sigma factor (sigma-70 family)